MVDEREDVGEAEQIGDQENQEDDQDRADDGGDGALAGRQLIQPTRDLAHLVIGQRRDPSRRLIGIDPERHHLGADVGPHVLEVPTTHADAYRFHLHARECLNRFDPPSLHESISWNERAVAADPNFAAAYSDLARAYLHLGIYFESALQNMPLALQNVRRALDIDSTLVDAHINLGCIHFMYEWDWKAAERELFAGWVSSRNQCAF